jgi:hypothetical protein
VLASRGARDLGAGVEPVADAGEAARLRRTARRVLIGSLSAGAAAAALAAALPV